MEIDFEPVWSWPGVLLIGLLLAGTVLFGYRNRIQHLPLSWQKCLWAVRIFLLLIILFWMIRPVAVIQSKDESSAVIYVVSDVSRSMETPDEPGGATRLESLTRTHETLNPLLEELSDQVEIRRRLFSDSLAVAAGDPLEPSGDFTAIGAALNSIDQESTTDRIAAVLLLADGRQTSTGEDDIDPLIVSRALRRRQAPVYTVTYGQAEVSGNSLDIAVSELDVSRDVFVRNVVPLRVRIRSAGIQGRAVPVRILIEDRSGQPGSKSGPMRAIRPDRENLTLIRYEPNEATDDTLLEFQFVPESIGELKIQVEAEPLDDEVRKTNNRVETIIRVRQGGIRVAYFDKVRPEQKWIRSIARSSRIELKYQPIREGLFADRNEFQDEWFVPGAFDAYIIGDVPAETIGRERLEALYRCCQNGAGLMMTGGFESFGAGGYHNTPLARLLPVEMSANDEHLTELISMHPTALGRSSSIMQITTPELNRQRWSELPPLTGINILRPRRDGFAQVLAESPDGLPLLIGQSVGSSRVLAFAGDTSWQWHMHETWGAEAFQRFWRQVIFWITRKDDDNNAPIWVNVEPRNVMPGRTAQLTFGARDGQGTPIPNAEYEVTVSSPDGDIESVTARHTDDQAAADYDKTVNPGDYWVQVNATHNGAPVGGTAVTRFLVNDRDPELDDPAADPGMMREIAHVSGGDTLTTEALVQRLQEWIDNGLPGLSVTRSQRISLWDNWISLLLFVALLCIEWAVRKKRGLV